jgi:hypothetical protein
VWGWNWLGTSGLTQVLNIIGRLLILSVSTKRAFEFIGPGMPVEVAVGWGEPSSLT